jgi:hypothetical protein
MKTKFKRATVPHGDSNILNPSIEKNQDPRNVDMTLWS